MYCKKILVTINESGNYVARFTAFVNEYYYYRHPLTDKKITSWSLFTNKMPREMIVALSTKESNDGNSTYSVLYSYISQLSIQTFYNSRNAETINGFGIETFNETPLYTFGKNSFNGDRSNGRQNQLNLLGTFNDYNNYYNPNWSDYIDYANNGWRSSVTSERATHKLPDYAYEEVGENYYNRDRYAYYACLSRNRDLNGNKKIDKNEVRWYLASLNEYIRISIGTGAISNAAKLYMGDKKEIGDNGRVPGSGTPYPLNYVDDGALYFTSSAETQRVYWAVERGSFGSENNSFTGGVNRGKPIRCIRLLPGTDENSSQDISVIENVTADPTFDSSTNSNGNYVLKFEGSLVESLYRERTNTTLDAHDEDDAANSFYDGIIVAKNNIKYPNGGDMKFSLSRIVNRNGNETDPCSEYYSEQGDGEATWRVPNLVEFSAMNAVTDSWGNPNAILKGGEACKTQFSQGNVRLGFVIANDAGIYMTCPGGSGNLEDEWNKEYSVRCVRDVEE